MLQYLLTRGDFLQYRYIKCYNHKILVRLCTITVNVQVLRYNGISKVHGIRVSLNCVSIRVTSNSVAL